MKLKPNETVITTFSKHFKRIFGANTTFGDIVIERKKNEIQQVVAELEFLSENTYCDTCKQYINEAFRYKRQAELRGKEKTLEAELAKVKAQQNSDNLMGNHVAEYLKDQSDFINKNKES